MSIIVIPNTFSAGAVIIASQHNSNFSTIYTDYNGNIDNNNIANNAAIAYSKLLLTGSIVNADISGSAGIADSKLAQITTASKVSGAALTSLSSTPSGAGLIPIANLATGTPNGTKFVRDDGTLQSAVNTYIAGTLNIASANTASTSTQTSYTKVKEIYIAHPGVITIKFDIHCTGGIESAYGRVYRNGSAVGTERLTTSGSYQTYSEDISGWSIGDLCQLYVKTSDSGSANSYRNFKLYVSNAEQEIVTLDT